MLTVVVGDDYAEVLKATELSAPRGRTERHGIPSQDAVTETHAHASGHAGETAEGPPERPRPGPRGFIATALLRAFGGLSC